MSEYNEGFEAGYQHAKQESIKEKEKMIAELEKRFEEHKTEMDKQGDKCDFDCYRLVLGQYTKEQKEEREVSK